MHAVFNLNAKFAGEGWQNEMFFIRGIIADLFKFF